MRGIVRQHEVDAAVVDRDAQLGIVAQILDPLPPVPHDPVVAERGAVLVSGPQTHHLS